MHELQLLEHLQSGLGNIPFKRGVFTSFSSECRHTHWAELQVNAAARNAAALIHTSTNSGLVYLLTRIIADAAFDRLRTTLICVLRLFVLFVIGNEVYSHRGCSIAYNEM